MSFREGKWLGILGLMLAPLSCTSLPEIGVPGGEMVGVQDLPSTGMVPLEWGSLVAVTPTEWRGNSLLWFQDDSGTIRSVIFDPQANQLHPQAFIIPRR